MRANRALCKDRIISVNLLNCAQLIDLIKIAQLLSSVPKLQIISSEHSKTKDFETSNNLLPLHLLRLQTRQQWWLLQKQILCVLL